MKNILLSLVFAGLALGQTALTQTTLSAAITASQDRFNVASATGISAGTMLYIQDFHAPVGELVQVASVSGTSLRVYRTQRPVAHASGARVIIAPTPVAFYTQNPTGACTAALTAYTPYINTNTGEQWLCSSVTGTWVRGWQAMPGESGPVTAVASAAGAITPSGPLFHITGTAAITGFTLPVGYAGGPFCVIPDGIFTTTTASNIALASTAVVSRTLCFTYDAVTAKFYPSY